VISGISDFGKWLKDNDPIPDQFIVGPNAWRQLADQAGMYEFQTSGVVAPWAQGKHSIYGVRIVVHRACPDTHVIAMLEGQIVGIIPLSLPSPKTE
jgi:hypothetical protein